jgi:hypothetical protein
MYLFSCSGPGAGETIARNIATGYTHAAIVGGVFVVSLVLYAIGPRRWIVPAIVLALIMLHPAWTISATRGDCGFLKRDASWVFTVIAALAIFTQGRIALDKMHMASPGGAAEDGTKLKDADGAIREGEPPIISRFKRSTDA